MSKVLVVFPSSIPVDNPATNGLVTAGLDITKGLKIFHPEIEFDLLGFLRCDPGGFRELHGRDFGSIARHNVQLMKDIETLHAKHQYDAIHIHSNFYVACSLGRIKDKMPKVILTMHSALMEGISANQARENNSYMPVYDDFTVTYPNYRTHEEYCKYFGADPTLHNYHMISNVVADAGFSPTSMNYILIVSRIDPNKNVEKGLKKAIEDAKATGHKVIFVGDSDVLVENKGSKWYKEQVLNLINENKDIVTWYDKMSKEGIMQLYRNATVTYHFSVKENQPLVPLESISAGTPVVGFSGILNMLEPQAAIKIDGKIPKDRNFVIEASKMDRQSVRQQYIENFSAPVVYRQWSKFYKDMGLA